MGLHLIASLLSCRMASLQVMGQSKVLMAIYILVRSKKASPLVKLNYYMLMVILTRDSSKMVSRMERAK